MCKTLMDHAKAFWKERFEIDVDELDKDARQKAYELWAEWSFSNMSGKNSIEQTKRMRDIEIWAAKIR